VFISHSETDKDICTKFKDKVLIECLGLTNEDIFFTSAPETAPPIGADWWVDILTNAEEAEVFIPLFTPNYRQSHTCNVELGLAYAFDRERILPVCIMTGNDSPAYLRKQSAKLDTPSSLTECLEAISEKLGMTFLKHNHEERLTKFCDDINKIWKPKRERNIIFLDTSVEAIIDTPWKGNERLTGFLSVQSRQEAIIDTPWHAEHITAIKNEVSSAIELNKLFNAQYLWSNPHAANHWRELCSGKEYIFYRDSKDYFQSSAKSVISLIRKEAPDILKSWPDYISLGPGLGEKDEFLLKALYKEYESEKPTLNYFPIDINIQLLLESVERIKGDLKKATKIKAISADFFELEQFRDVYDSGSRAKIFTLLGNTLGNYYAQDVSLLMKILSVMDTGDILLLEVRLKTDKPPKAQGKGESKRFNFGPLETCGIELEEGNFHYNTEKNTDSRVESRVANTSTVVGIYQTELWKRTICCIHHYDEEMLKAKLKEIGFDLLGEPLLPNKERIHRNNAFGVFVLQKT
jgi:hypothetical protein